MSHTYVKAESAVTGRRAVQVAGIMSALAEKKGEGPQPYEDMCSDLGIKYPADLLPAMYALELAGVVTRYTFTKRGSTRSLLAFEARVDEDGNPFPPS